MTLIPLSVAAPVAILNKARLFNFFVIDTKSF